MIYFSTCPFSPCSDNDISSLMTCLVARGRDNLSLNLSHEITAIECRSDDVTL